MTKMEFRDNAWTWLAWADDGKIQIEAIHACGAKFHAWITEEESRGDPYDGLRRVIRYKHDDCPFDTFWDRVNEVH